MKYNKLVLTSIMLLLVMITGACNLPQPGVEVSEDISPTEDISADTPTSTPSDEGQPTADQEIDPPDPASKRYSFDQLGISLEVPSELYVFKDPNVNYDDPSKLDGYLFYIQNYGYREGPHTGDFQMYGLLQYDLFPISWEQFASNTIDHFFCHFIIYPSL